MDPFDQLDFKRRRVNIQAIIAFVLGVVAAYLIHQLLGLRQSGLFTTLIVLAVGGLWYHIRRVV